MLDPSVMDNLAEWCASNELPFRLEGEFPGRILNIDGTDKDGFSISVQEDDDGEWIVAFGENGVHSHVSEAEKDDISELIGLALSENCRLREVWRGDFWHRGRLEARSEARWERITETALLFFPFWKQRRETIRQNHHFNQSSSSS